MMVLFISFSSWDHHWPWLIITPSLVSLAEVWVVDPPDEEQRERVIEPVISKGKEEITES